MVMTNFYNITVQNSAQRDLDGIWDYIANDLNEPVTAARTLDKLYHAMISLKGMPGRHALLTDEHLKKKGVRKLLVENYIVFYKINEAKMDVAILRVLHGSQNWKHIL
jgi:addiction module RelE/StbE family toxin